ncbi:MAG: hypothetical protein ACR2FG_05185 [Marmoricola sp.]
MTDEASAAAAAEPTDEPTEEPSAQPTGHPAVDGALASLAGLEERPVGEHVAVFENAHEALRRALNDAGEA